MEIRFTQTCPAEFNNLALFTPWITKFTLTHPTKSDLSELVWYFYSYYKRKTNLSPTNYTTEQSWTIGNTARDSEILRTDGPRDRRTNKARFIVACPQLKWSHNMYIYEFKAAWQNEQRGINGWLFPVRVGRGSSEERLGLGIDAKHPLSAW